LFRPFTVTVDTNAKGFVPGTATVAVTPVAGSPPYAHLLSLTKDTLKLDWKSDFWKSTNAKTVASKSNDFLVIHRTGGSVISGTINAAARGAAGCRAAFGKCSVIPVRGPLVLRPARVPSAPDNATARCERDQPDVLTTERPELAIVEPGTWDRVQARLLGNARSTSATPKRRTTYLLSSLLRCGVCGALLEISSGSSDRYCRCSASRKRGTCEALRSYLRGGQITLTPEQGVYIARAELFPLKVALDHETSGNLHCPELVARGRFVRCTTRFLR
jgi:hypothetical protein